MTKRYVRAYKIKEDTILKLAPPGMCQWCGEDLKGKQRWWCSKPCKREFYEYWLRVPRFKRAILLRDGFICQICGIEPTKLNRFALDIPDLSKLSIDHKIPVSKGGTNDPSNLQCACRKCNAIKSDNIIGEEPERR